MKITEKLLEAYAALSLNKLKKLSDAKFVEMRSNGYIRRGEITRPPYFKINPSFTTHNNQKLAIAEGTWWIDIYGEAHSLKDFNVILNNYNTHTMLVIDSLDGIRT